MFNFGSGHLAEILASFLLGVLASLVAAYLYAKIQRLMAREPKLDMEGVWGEHIPSSAGRSYTIGRIYFDNRRKIYAFDGTNFNNDGGAFCFFDTMASHVDLGNRKFYYIFSANIQGRPGETYYGFGVINLERMSDDRMVPVRGYYLSDSVDGEPMQHSMQLLPDVQYSQTMDAAAILPQITKI